MKTGEWRLPPLKLKRLPDEKKKKDHKTPKQEDFERLREVLSSGDPKTIEETMRAFKEGSAPWKERWKKPEPEQRELF